MLDRKTSSANNLRIQSSRRHDIRNLRAKVRSLLPPEMCHKQQKLGSKLYRLQVKRPQASLQNNMRSKFKDFQKLTLRQIEQIIENKYYFLGNEESIAYFDRFIKTNYPHLKSPWISPEPYVSPLSFPLANFQQNLIKKSLGSPSPVEKRSSCQSANVFRKEEIRQWHRGGQRSREKAEGCCNRRQALQEERKVKREISSVYLQRQQQLAVDKKSNLLKQRMQQSHIRSKSRHIGEATNSNKIMEVQTADLATKLRRICLRRSQQNYTAVLIRH